MRPATGRDERLMSGQRRPPLKALSAFEAAARHAGFARAAAELGVTPAAVSYQVKQVEEHYGVALFERASQGVVLTPAGAALRDKVAAALAFIDEGSHALAEGQRREMLLVAVPVSFGLKWLLPRVASFQSRCPEIELRLRTIRGDRDRLAAPPDVEIAFGQPGHGDARLEPLGEESFHPLVAAGPAAGDDLDLLRRAPLLHFDRSVVPWPLWLAHAGLAREASGRDLVLDRAFLTLDAAVAGLGLALEGELLAGEERRSGRLRPLLLPGLPPIRRCRYYLRHPEPGAAGRKFGLFRDWLMTALEDWRAAGQGGLGPGSMNSV
jgi:LysR family glycine cleavage system transcriptional activator